MTIVGPLYPSPVTHTDTFSVAIWNATQYFKKSKAPSKQFTFDLLPMLPCMTTDPTFGDIIIVLYSVLSYNCENGMELSLNLYSIVLVLRYQK